MTEGYKTEENENLLTPKQSQAISLLATGESVTATAETLNVSRKTVSFWLNHNAAFAGELRRLQTFLFDEAASRLRGLTTRAMEVLSETLLESPSERVRFAAAIKILSLNTSALIPPSKPPEAKTPAKLCENCEQEKISEIMSGFDQ